MTHMRNNPWTGHTEMMGGGAQRRFVFASTENPFTLKCL